MGNKRPLEWHKENLKNMKLYEKQIDDDIKTATIRKARLQGEIMLLESQIKCAEREWKTEFDATKYALIKRHK